MDLDCLGSLILVKKLFPDYTLVRSRIIHPVAYRLYHLYQDRFNCINPKDVAEERVENIIIVDTSSSERVKEYFSHINNSYPKIRIYDHHVEGECDILGAELFAAPWGSNTTFLGKLAMEKGLCLETEEATIALTGIYADTGRLSYEGVRREDFEVAAWLLDQGASLRLVKSFLETIQEDDQITALNQLLLTAEKRNIQGHEVLLSYLELEENIPGLAAVVEKIMEIENPDAYFAVFFIRKNKSILVIGRSQKRRIDLHKLFAAYGGGGHQLAGSVKISGREGPGFFKEFLEYLETSLVPATRAADIMSRKVFTVNENVNLLEASIYMEEVNHTGLPVLNDAGELTGFLTLREIMKGRRASRMHCPVKAFMSKDVINADSSITMREVERLFYKYHIGHLPIVEEGRLTGIVTRRDFLEYQKRRGRSAPEGNTQDTGKQDG
jgi:tRNA nucleotidyltransferase (CCA-adding enzyme)